MKSFAAALVWLVVAVAQADDAARYAEIRRLIRANRHMSGHLVLAVDTRTIKAVRKKISDKDLPILIQMMGDKDYGVASAASGLAVTLGEPARPALVEAAKGYSTIAMQARDALTLLDQCAADASRGVVNADVCPVQKAR